MQKKIRLDLHLLTKGLVESRQQAQRLILAGKVSDLFGKILDKPGKEVDAGLEIRIKKLPRFVSRGGEKLIAGLNSFPLNIADRICLDAGISTGGFTDCLLQNGAALVYGIDVGYGQTAWNLRNNPRVVLRERTNIRTLLPEDLYGSMDPKPNFAVADLSFISLRLVLPSIKALLVQEINSEALFLVKPQFEVGKDRISKGGVVRDRKAHIEALLGVISIAINLDWFPRGVLLSPITGPAGNHEYLLWLGQRNDFDLNNLKAVVPENL